MGLSFYGGPELNWSDVHESTDQGVYRIHTQIDGVDYELSSPTLDPEAVRKHFKTYVEAEAAAKQYGSHEAMMEAVMLREKGLIEKAKLWG